MYGVLIAFVLLARLWIGACGTVVILFVIAAWIAWDVWHARNADHDDDDDTH